MITRNDAVAVQLFCAMMMSSDALPVLSTKNDGHCHHLRMGVFPDPSSIKILRGWLARLAPPLPMFFFNTDFNKSDYYW